MSSIKRRKLQVEMPNTQGGNLNLGRSGSRHHPHYSLNSILPNPSNPRKPDLLRAGIDLDVVKKLRRKPDESIEDCEVRVRKWVDERSNLTDAAAEIWHRFINLAVDIHHDGLHQPISVRENDPASRVALIVSGERRFLAHWLNGATTVGAMVVNMDDEKASKMALVENFQREDMSLNASILALRSHQDAYGHTFSMAEIGRLLGLSKGGSQGVYNAVNADEGHAVFAALESGELSKPYHVKKFFDQIKPKRAQPSGASESERSNLTDGNGSDQLAPERQTKGVDRSNLTANEGASTETGQGPAVVDRSNLTGADGSQVPRKQQEQTVERSNLTDKPESKPVVSADRWESMRDFLASITFDLFDLTGSEKQRLSDRIEQTGSAVELEDLVAEMAELYKRSGGVES